MQSSVVGLHFTFLVSYNLGQNLLRILFFLTHRTPIPRIWYRYGPLSSAHPNHSCSVGMRNDLVFLAAVFISSHNAPSPTKGCSYSNHFGEGSTLGRGVSDETKTAVRETRNDPAGLRHHLLWRDGEYFSLSVFSRTLS